MPTFQEEYFVGSSFIRKIAVEISDDRGKVHITMFRQVKQGQEPRCVTYVYEMWEKVPWDNFKAAASKGKYYNRAIKGRFRRIQKY